MKRIMCYLFGHKLTTTRDGSTPIKMYGLIGLDNKVYTASYWPCVRCSNLVGWVREVE